MEPTFRQTRSGKEYSPWRVVKAPEDFDYAALLRKSTQDAEKLEMLDDIDVMPSEAIAQPAGPTTAPQMPYSSAGLFKPFQNPSQNQANAGPCKQKGAAPKSMSKANLRRKDRRISQKIEHGHRPSAAAFDKYVKGASTISVSLDSLNLPATSGGYGAKNLPKTPSFQHGLSKDELVEKHGCTPLEWNGIDPILVVDEKDRVCLALVGRPKEECYWAAATSVHETLLAEGAAAGLTENAVLHLRGRFPALNVGAMHGKGTTNPINLSTKGNEPHQ
ncbi:hypothetical protein HYPSUDRAFT_210166 [Hypholoma sublateritium FD-334 SS-4]|uniref:Uncharacterized protein n=1 Tax=Hypholoma sublateritium (strain FD-334 SS-4) TaxID=945553 RepID=A0A0D2N7K9_HYPSF|nr:hypothetical protein HYPSUDRAFT_210166 [Hypholoma sublateritium FD-334 SS-4]